MPETPRGLQIGWPLALATLALLLYAGALRNPLLVDDPILIEQNPLVQEPLGGLVLWFTDYWAGLAEDRNLYRPVTTFSLWLNARLGDTPAGYHVANLLLHALAAWLVGLWCRRLYGLVPGIAASLLVLLHPVASDVANRIVGRADVLVLAGTAGFLWQQDVARRRGWTGRRALAGGALVFLALGAKESGIALVALAALAAALAWRGSARDAWLAFTRGDAPLALAAVAVPTLFYLAARVSVVGVRPSYRGLESSDLMGNPLMDAGLVERLPASLALAWKYLAILVFPWPLHTYNVPLDVPGWTDPSVWLGAGVLAGACVGFVQLARRRSPAAIAVAWLLGFWALVSQLAVPIGEYFGARLAYPMLGGAGLLLAAGVASLRDRPRSWRVAAVTAAVACSLLAVLVVTARNRDWRGPVALTLADARRQPDNPSAQLRLGSGYAQEERWAEARDVLERVTEGEPRSPRAWHDLGAVELELGRPAKARAIWERALALDPTHWRSMLQLARLEMLSGSWQAAHAQIERMAPHAPPLVIEDARRRLRLERLLAGAREAFGAGMVERSRELCQQILAEDPHSPPAHLLLARIERRAGLNPQAIARLRALKANLPRGHPDYDEIVAALERFSGDAP